MRLMGIHSASLGIERMDAGGLCAWDSLKPTGVVLSAGVDCGAVDLRYSSRTGHRMVGTGWRSTLQWTGLPSSGEKLPPEVCDSRGLVSS